MLSILFLLSPVEQCSAATLGKRADKNDGNDGNNRNDGNDGNNRKNVFRFLRVAQPSPSDSPISESPTANAPRSPQTPGEIS